MLINHELETDMWNNCWKVIDDCQRAIQYAAQMRHESCNHTDPRAAADWLDRSRFNSHSHRQPDAMKLDSSVALLPLRLPSANFNHRSMATHIAAPKCHIIITVAASFWTVSYMSSDTVDVVVTSCPLLEDCLISCQFGFVSDEDGCRTCHCHDPCKVIQASCTIGADYVYMSSTQELAVWMHRMLYWVSGVNATENNLKSA